MPFRALRIIIFAWKHRLKSPSSECSKVGAPTMEAISRCPNLVSLNLSHTSVTPVSLVGVLQSCGGLETLKVAGIKNWVRACNASGLLHLIYLPYRPMGRSKSSPPPWPEFPCLTSKGSISVNSSSQILLSLHSLTSVVT